MPTRRFTSATVLFAAGLGAVLVPAMADAAPPSAPTGVSVIGQTISWTDTATDETGFAIERCLGAGCTAFGQIATVPAGTTSYSDTFAAVGTNRYRVRAFNADGPSGYSNVAEQTFFGVGQVFAIASATPVSGTAPLTVTLDGSASVDLSGTPATGHTWRFGDNQAGTGAVAAHTYTTPGIYAASLRVTGGAFNSTDSTAVLITVTAPPLAVATNLSGTAPSRGRIVLTWTNPPSSATSIGVERCKGSTCSTFTRIATLAPTASTYTDATVKGGTTYSYRLAATEGGVTVYSNRAVVTSRK
jgi:PKD repeat protein